MKELSIFDEIKAKRYDEAIQRANELNYVSDKDSLQRKTVEHIFPELNESEDERMIKCITLLVNGLTDEHFIRCGASFEEIKAWLEKKGEQKPSDKVEPKFHEGDWIIHHGTENIYQVVAIIDNQYQLKYGDNYTVQKCVDVDRCARLWDITKDAKDGDVLFTSSTASHETFVFKGIDEKGNAKCYFAYDSEDGFREGTYHFIGRAANCKPATKEQRDLLFQKMREGGYEWDVKKKELTKIENKSSWSEEDEKYSSYICAALDCYYRLREDRNNTNGQEDLDKARNWLYNKLKSLRPQNSATDEELAQAKKEAYNDALDKIEYHSGEPTFDDGWSAAIWYLKKKNAQP